MGGTQITLTFSAIVESWDRIPESALPETYAGRSPIDDAVRDMLDTAMRQAGEQFMAEHPALFRPGVGLI